LAFSARTGPGTSAGGKHGDGTAPLTRTVFVSGSDVVRNRGSARRLISFAPQDLGICHSRATVAESEFLQDRGPAAARQPSAEEVSGRWALPPFEHAPRFPGQKHRLTQPRQSRIVLRSCSWTNPPSLRHRDETDALGHRADLPRRNGLCTPRITCPSWARGNHCHSRRWQDRGTGNPGLADPPIRRGSPEACLRRSSARVT
jgi:hypothetical protein